MATAGFVARNLNLAPTRSRAKRAKHFWKRIALEHSCGIAILYLCYHSVLVNLEVWFDILHEPGCFGAGILYISYIYIFV